MTRKKTFYIAIGLSVSVYAAWVGFSKLRESFLGIPAGLVDVLESEANKPVSCIDIKKIYSKLDVPINRNLNLTDLENKSDELNPVEYRSLVRTYILRRDPDRVEVVDKALNDKIDLVSNDECLSPFFVAMLSSDSEVFRKISNNEKAAIGNKFRADLYLYGIYYCDENMFDYIAPKEEYYDEKFWGSLSYSPLLFAETHCPKLVPILKNSGVYNATWSDRFFVW